MILEKLLLNEILIKVDNYDQSQRETFLEQCTEVIINKVVIKILQGSVISQTVLGGLTSLYTFQRQISKSVYLPKIIVKIG